jgi:hypothetical protein
MNRRTGRLVVSALLLTALACSDRSLLVPELPVDPPVPAPPPGSVLTTCRADVRAAQVDCAPPGTPGLPGGASGDLVIGGQDLYVRLASSGTAYDAGEQKFTTTVTVQNLTRHLMGTPDGLTVAGLRVFFHTGPTVTAGTGVVSLANPSGHQDFTGTEPQPFFEYATILDPLSVSSGMQWVFDMPTTVELFYFTVYVAAPLSDESGALLGPVWAGTASTEWGVAGNWRSGVVPDQDALATVLPMVMLAPGAHLPSLGESAAVKHLRIGAGSSLGLGGHVLTVHGNVDAVGTVSGGALIVSGSGVRIGGVLPEVRITGDAVLQRTVHASGPLTISDGSLGTSGLPLTIIIP